MTAPYLGGFKITGAEWLSARALKVRFSTTYGTTYHHQLYAGRSFVGVTDSLDARSIVGQVIPSEYPQHLQIVAVDPAERLTDYGDRLPPRPYNRVKLGWSTSSWPSDAKFIDVTAGTTAGGAVSSSNRLERLFYDTDRAYQITTKPLTENGTWNFEVTGRDNRQPNGNAGTALALSATVLTHPPDVNRLSSGGRLSVDDVSAGVATVTVSY